MARVSVLLREGRVVRLNAMIATDPDPTAPTTPMVEVYARPFTVEAPFDAEATLNKPSHFPSPIEARGNRVYQFVAEVCGFTCGCTVEYEDERNDVNITLYQPQGSDTDKVDYSLAIAEIQRRLGLKADLEGYEAIWRRDAILSALPCRMIGARPSSPFSLFEFLIICTLLQNTGVRRTVQMMNTLTLQFGTRYILPSEHVIWGLGRPSQLAQVGEARLREQKLGYRAKTLTRLAQFFIDRPTFADDLLTEPDPAVYVQMLRSIYGVGPASVGYIGFEWLKSLDLFDHVSPWEHRILSRALLGSQDMNSLELIHFCKERWAPFTMLAVHALFESIFWQREKGGGPEWLDALIRL